MKTYVCKETSLFIILHRQLVTDVVERSITIISGISIRFHLVPVSDEDIIFIYVNIVKHCLGR